jgi:pyruvate dehydrogenase E2 component (dihydrolipoamide acetyltransferase)
MEEGVLLSWLKGEGDEVAVDEPIAEIETDKTVLEIPSPVAGRLGPRLYAEGAIVPTGAVVTTVLEAGDADPALPAEVAGPSAPAETDSGSLGGLDAGARVEPRTPHRQSPRQRMLAERRDAGSVATAAQATGDLPASPSSWPAAGGRRSLIAGKVAASWQSIPHFGVTREIEADAIQATRADWTGSGHLSVTDVLVRALGLALREVGHPQPIDVGLAVATPNGVMVPVLRDLMSKDLAQLRSAREAAVERSQAGRLESEDITSPPSVTLSNLGPFGVDQFTGIIAVGQVALLTVGQIRPRAVVAGTEVVVRPTFFATLNVDHRVFDGDAAARLLAAFATVAQNKVQLQGLSPA